ncbi:ABC transporter substrate-binding protein [Pseudomonas sp. dw_358]|uniref:ABC transporter substrate-binding protein n=1 Tax=Pseudomonas sp. dw_358 TaxID=2720083 RepID=UPI001BD53976|nr:ABC transporter substrate-binding protein [Pseudomonas sp. dw_358]
MPGLRNGLCIALLSPLLLTACGDGTQDKAVAAAATGQPAAGGNLSIAVAGEPVCFDPHRSGQQNSFLIMRNYIDSLVGKQADGSFVPWLAKSWDISPDGRTYHFVLRDDVTFSNGEPFDAQAVKANFDWVANPANTAMAATFMEYYLRTDVIGPHEVNIVLSRPDSSMLESFSSVKLGFIAPKALASAPDLCGGGPQLVGTGPFVFDQYQRGQSARFVKNPHYQWPPAYASHPGPAYLDSVTYRFLPEYAVRAGALTSGQVDVIEGVQPTDIPLFKDAPGFQYLVGPSAETSFTLNVNYTHGPATDVRVRQALRDGFDVDAVVKNIYLGTVPRAWSDIGPDNPDSNKALAHTWGNNVAHANQLLDEAGWTGRDSEGYRTQGGQRLRIEVGFPQPYVRDNRDLLIQQIQAAVKKNIGLDLDLRIITGGEFAKSRVDGSWNIYPNTLNPSDTALSLRDVLGRTGFYSGVQDKIDPQIADGIDKARATSDLNARRPILAQIQQRAVEQAYIVPLFAPSFQLAAKDSVHGLSFEAQLDSPSNFHDVWTQH